MSLISSINETKTLIRESELDESLKIAKQQYLEPGKVSQVDFDKFKEIDPTARLNKYKYLPTMLKFHLAGIDFSRIQSQIEEFDVLVNRHIIQNKDINSYKIFSDLEKDVAEGNAKAAEREKENQQKQQIKDQAIILKDNPDMFVVSPRTHEASCFYGQGTRWCVAGNYSGHWQNYFYGSNVTFVYIQLRSEKLRSLFKDPNKWKVAIVDRNGSVTSYDASDKMMNTERTAEYLKQIGLKLNFVD